MATVLYPGLPPHCHSLIHFLPTAILTTLSLKTRWPHRSRGGCSNVSPFLFGLGPPEVSLLLERFIHLLLPIIRMPVMMIVAHTSGHTSEKECNKGQHKWPSR